MGDARHRRTSASASISLSRENSSKALGLKENGGQRAGSSSVKMEEEEEENRKRTTRGRNPLPPTKGPLFPPLPPKVPKTSPQSARPSTTPAGPSGSLAEEEEAEADSEQLEVPNTSNASLTPPPPGSEEAAADLEAGQGTDEEEDEDARTSDDWEGQRKARGARVKVEITEDLPDETTPRRRKGKARDVSNSADATPTASVDGARSVRADSSSRQNRKRRGEEALLLDDHLLPEELRRTMAAKKGLKDPESTGKAAALKVEEGEEDDDQDEEEEQKDVTRCVCHQDDIDVMMIQCDQCNVWQHGPCMGIWEDVEAPDEYFCEECKPELHGPLKRWIRLCGRNPALYVPPTPADLKKFQTLHDRLPPSQSKRWPPPAKMEPPPKPPRSHHKQKLDSPEESVDSRRGNRTLAAAISESKDKDQEVEEVHHKPKSVSVPRRKDSSLPSVSPERSISPSASTHPIKKRSTMNSRDSAYEDAVRAAMQASRLEMSGKEGEVEEVIAAEELDHEMEKEKIHKGKRKRDEEEAGGVHHHHPLMAELADVALPAGKPKHPNQYTYRPKPLAVPVLPPVAPTPARRVIPTATPVPTLPPPQHDHGTRRAGAMVNGAVANPSLNAHSVASLHWFMPEHLSSYSDLLPATRPKALQVQSALSWPSISRNHFHNHRYGPFDESRDDNGSLHLPIDPPHREPPADASTHLEPPARIRFPAKRITVAEMRKRVRHMLEYVGKVQGEEAKRAERARQVGLEPRRRPEVSDLADLQSPGQENDTRSAAELMDELTRELLAFQETFSMNGFASPMPPLTSTFESQLPSMLSANLGNTVDDPAMLELPSASTNGARSGSRIGDGRVNGSGSASGGRSSPDRDRPDASDHVGNDQLESLLSLDDLSDITRHAPTATSDSTALATAPYANGADANEALPVVTETTTESVDVYREGKINQVVSELEERDAVEVIDLARERRVSDVTGIDVGLEMEMAE